MGLTVELLRGSYNSPRNVFRNVSKITLVNVDGPSEPSPQAPAARIVSGPSGTIHIVPDDPFTEFQNLGDGFVSSGGSFAYSTDSRFSQAVGKLLGVAHVAIAVHDFFETYEENARMD